MNLVGRAVYVGKSACLNADHLFFVTLVSTSRLIHPFHELYLSAETSLHISGHGLASLIHSLTHIDGSAQDASTRKLPSIGRFSLFTPVLVLRMGMDLQMNITNTNFDPARYSRAFILWLVVIVNLDSRWVWLLFSFIYRYGKSCFCCVPKYHESIVLLELCISSIQSLPISFWSGSNARLSRQWILRRVWRWILRVHWRQVHAMIHLQ